VPCWTRDVFTYNVLNYISRQMLCSNDDDDDDDGGGGGGGDAEYVYHALQSYQEQNNSKTRTHTK